MKISMLVKKYSFAWQIFGIILGIVLFKIVLLPIISWFYCEFTFPTPNLTRRILMLSGASVGTVIVITLETLIHSLLLLLSGLAVGGVIAFFSKGCEVSRTFLGLLICIVFELKIWYDAKIMDAFAATKSFSIFILPTILIACIIIGGLLSAILIDYKRRPTCSGVDGD